MNMRDLIPWGRSGHGRTTLFRDEPGNPFLTLHREVNRLFDETFRSFDSPVPFGSLFGWPNVELTETDREIRVSAELPGLDEDDVEVLLTDGMLTLRGEKRSEVDDEQRRFSERVYGRFERQIRIGSEIDQDKVTASFKNGVLTVILPKTEKAQSQIRRIAVNGK